MAKETTSYFDALRDTEERIAKEKDVFAEALARAEAQRAAEEEALRQVRAQAGAEPAPEPEQPSLSYGEAPYRAAQDVDAPAERPREEEVAREAGAEEQRPPAEINEPGRAQAFEREDGDGIDHDQDDAFSVTQQYRLKEIADEARRIHDYEFGVHYRSELGNLFDRVENENRREFDKRFPEGVPLDTEELENFQTYMAHAFEAVRAPDQYLSEHPFEPDITVERNGRGRGAEREADDRRHPGPGDEFTDAAAERSGVRAGRERKEASQPEWESGLSEFARAMEQQDRERPGPGMSMGGP